MIDASGSASGRKLAVDVLRPGGMNVLVGQREFTSDADQRDVIAKELTIAGSYAYTDHDFTRAIQLLASGMVDADSMITTAPMSQALSLFQELSQGSSRLHKVVLIA